MKKILFYLTIAWAVFFPKSFCAPDMELASGFKIEQQEGTFSNCQLIGDNASFDDFLADISDDDTNDSERKRLSSGKPSYTNTYLIAQKRFYNTLKKTLSIRSFHFVMTSLFIFIRVLRL